MNVKVNRITLLGNVISKIAELERKVDPTYIDLIASKLRDVITISATLDYIFKVAKERNYVIKNCRYDKWGNIVYKPI